MRCVAAGSTVLTGLDLTALQREDGPPTELQARREKFTYFEKHCSEVADGLYIGSDAVAKSRQTLKDAHITHVINCVGFLYPSYFKDELSYKVLYLQGLPVLHSSVALIEIGLASIC